MPYAAADALSFAKEMVKYQPFDRADLNPQALDMAAKMFWMYAPWRWTIGTLAPIAITGGVDYAVTPPADFLYLQQAWIADGDKTITLDILPSLPEDPHIKGVPRMVSFVPDTPDSFVRLYPEPLPSSTKYLQLHYKKAHTEINGANVATAGALGFPDEWFPVFQELVLYYAYLYADDDRAGSVTLLPNRQSQYTGQLGKALALMEDMKLREDLLFDLPGTIQSKEQR